jgi:hypothetical protein
MANRTGRRGACLKLEAFVIRVWSLSLRVSVVATRRLRGASGAGLLPRAEGQPAPRALRQR